MDHGRYSIYVAGPDISTDPVGPQTGDYVIRGWLAHGKSRAAACRARFRLVGPA
jgi:hypothetical protein